MLSICIPVYNEFVESLIKELFNQKNNVGDAVEIVVIDDRSDIKIKQENRKLKKYIDIYIELDENIGRPKIRNRFLKYATHSNLLFIDSDSVIESPVFIKKYMDAISSNSGSVIEGGAVYSKKRPGKNMILKWIYGSKVESQPVDIRNINPYKSFNTKNVLIPREVLEGIPFNENLLTYGHDDTFMGYALKKKGVKIVHIDNPITNSDNMDVTEVFLAKTSESVQTLIFILNEVKGDKYLFEDVKLLSFLQKVYKLRMQTPLYFTLKLLLPLIKYYLKDIRPSMFLFSLYKLYYALYHCRVTNAKKYLMPK